MKTIKKVFIIIFINLLLITNTYALDISSTHAVLYNLEDNSIVLDINKDDKTSIASLTKIMTCLVALDKINDMNDKVTITYSMLKGLIEDNAYVIGLKRGQVLTYKDLLYGTFLESGADAARGLALSLASSEEEYVSFMNEKAIELGLPELHFANVIGLDDVNNYGTVDAVAKLLMKALENDTFKEMYLTPSYLLSDNSMTVYSSMRYSAKTYNLDISYIEGGKTGLTDDAGKCLASTAFDSKNKIHYLLVTTGASTSKKNAYHILDATKIYNYYFDNYKYHDVILPNDLLVTFDIKYSKTKINIINDEALTYYGDMSFDKDKVRIVYDGITTISPFIGKDEKLGQLSIYYEDELLKEEDIYSNMLDIEVLNSVQKDLGFKTLIVIIGTMFILIILRKTINHLCK